MLRKWKVLAVCASLTLAIPATAEARSPASYKREIRSLKAEVIRLQVQRDVARDAIGEGLAAQVAEVAKIGSLPQLAESVFEPIRVNWPCGASVFQGQTFWSIDVETTDTDYSGDTPKFTDCH